jgi:hypothetical protein
MFILAFSPTAGFSRGPVTCTFSHSRPSQGWQGDRAEYMFLPCFLLFQDFVEPVTFSLGYPMVYPRDRVTTVENGRTVQKL